MTRKKKRYKALMIDVDATLIPNREDGMPSQKVTNAINNASEKIHIGVATSRPQFMLSHIFSHLKLSGPSIINGGSQIMDVSSGNILWEQSLLLEDYKKVRAILDKTKYAFYIHDQEKDFGNKDNYVPKNPLNVGCINLTPDQADKLIDILSYIPTIAVHKVPDWVKNRFTVFISHAAATKQHGILEIAKILNIKTHDIIGIGDGYNDFPLLMACGLKVAMGNAVPELKEIADYIAPRVEEDGVADVIEKFVL